MCAVLLAAAQPTWAKPLKPVAVPQPTTGAPAVTYGGVPVAPEASPSAATKVDATVIYQEAQRLLWSDNVNDVARAAELFAEASQTMPQAMSRFQKAIGILREKSPDLAGRVMTKVVTAYGTGGFDKVLEIVYADLRKGFADQGFDPARRAKMGNSYVATVASAGFGPVSDCAAFVDRLALMADIASARGLEETKMWRLQTIDNLIACESDADTLARAYEQYLTLGDGESAKATAAKRAEKLVERFTGKAAGTPWQAADFIAARDACLAAGLTMADMQKRLDPVALEAEKSARYGVAVEAYRAIGRNDEANALMPMLGDK